MTGPLPIIAEPRNDRYDVVIVGGGIMGSSVAWWLTHEPAFDGSVLVLERDPTYTFAQTSHTNSCMRQQFSNELNVRISQFAADFVRNFRTWLEDEPEVPELAVHHFGYLYLAGDDRFAEALRANQRLQAGLGAGTRILSPEEIVRDFPFMHVDDIVCGSHNPVDEGYFDGGTLFDQWRRSARRGGVEYISAEVVGLDHDGRRVSGVRLDSGRTVLADTVVNAAGTRASIVAAMAGIELAVEPRKRFTFVFDCADDLGADLPLTIDPSGVHVRQDGEAFMTGCGPDVDLAVGHDDFVMDDDIFEAKIWPILAHRIPAFERIKVRTRWAGHYAYHPLDHNAIVGPHPELGNLLFVNGFSGHGLQQSPAMGRGLCELIVHGEYRSLDLSPFGYERVADGAGFDETAVI